MGSDTTSSAVCWVVSDGRAGIENQALGLAEAVRTEAAARGVAMDLSVRRARLRAPWSTAPRRFVLNPLARLSPGADPLEPPPPAPALVIGCGRQAAALLAGLKRRAPHIFAVQLQDPRGDRSVFDLVIPPEHDGLSGPNVFPIVGSPNRITPAVVDTAAATLSERINRRDDAPIVGALIGGPNKAYAFTEEDAAHVVDAVRKASAVATVIATTSRRTPAQIAPLLRAELPGPEHLVYDPQADEPTENPYPGLLGLAQCVLVTADSVNMVAEAASAACPTLLIPLALRRGVAPGGRKFDRFHTAMAARDALRRFEGSFEPWPAPRLDETRRAAREIIARWLD